MCGIAGRYNGNGLVENPEWAPKVSELLRHRGPDGDGFFTDPYCELVHRRLALVDLTPTGHQPMTNEDGSLWIVFNGEIYDYETLRKSLINQGHFLRGTSDTEVLLHLYEDYGKDMLCRIKGIFAFAIYDQKQRSLFLARDRFGTKPLYYTQVNGQWIFASELKAILAWPGIRLEMDRQAVYDFLSWGYIPEPATGFKHIYALPKGSYLIIRPDTQQICQYYQPEPQPVYHGSLNDAVEAVSERIQNAVRVQRVADVPVGSLLSGGIDSGLVTAAYAKVSPQPFYTFTIGFPDADYDETALAAQTARHLGTQHTVISLHDWHLGADEAIDLMTHFDQPFSDTSLFAVNLVTKGIREHGLRSALSGDGGDEAFGGYDFFRHISRLLPLHRLPGTARSLASAGSRSIIGRRYPGYARQIRRAVDVASSENTSEFLAQLTSYQTERQKQELINPAVRDGLLPVNRFYQPFEHGWDEENVAAQLTSGMFNMLLPGDMLKKVDMMSMRNSVEIRVPILDEALIDLALQLPRALKANRTENKIVLRSLANRWLPAEISQAKKRGFGVPLDVLAAQSLHETIRESLLSPTARINTFINTDLVHHWVQLFEQGKQGAYALEVSREGLYQRLFFLLSLELWMQKYQLVW